MPTKHKAYYARIEAGLCGQCGKRALAVNSDGTKLRYCEECRRKTVEARRRYRAELRKKERERYKEHRAQEVENKEQIDYVLSAGRYVRCLSCGVVTNTMFYFCPWCGVKQNFIRGEE